MILESVQAWIVYGGAKRGAAHTLLALVEEFMEMAGVAVFAFALLRYLAARSSVRLDFGDR